jgi:hypothetical protein
MTTPSGSKKNIRWRSKPANGSCMRRSLGIIGCFGGSVKTRTLLVCMFCMLAILPSHIFFLAAQAKVKDNSPPTRTLANPATPRTKDLAVAKRHDNVVLVAKQENSLRYCIEEDDDGLNTAARKRLELLHIPKTGGRALEFLAAQNGIKWGACHWYNKIRGDVWILCPRPRPKPRPSQNHPDTGTSNWHVPIVPYFNNSTMFNPYINATIFVVVRDPFSRAVSEAVFRELETRNPCASNATWLNEEIASRLERAETDPHNSDSHWIPQHEFLRIHQHDDEKPYVLRFESLKRDFACLTKKHGLNLSLQHHHPSQERKGEPKKLTRANLTGKTKGLIRAFYRKDFEMFGYATDF